MAAPDIEPIDRLGAMYGADAWFGSDGEACVVWQVPGSGRIGAIEALRGTPALPEVRWVDDSILVLRDGGARPLGPAMMSGRAMTPLRAPLRFARDYVRATANVGGALNPSRPRFNYADLWSDGCADPVAVGLAVRAWADSPPAQMSFHHPSGPERTEARLLALILGWLAAGTCPFQDPATALVDASEPDWSAAFHRLPQDVRTVCRALLCAPGRGPELEQLAHVIDNVAVVLPPPVSVRVPSAGFLANDPFVADWADHAMVRDAVRKAVRRSEPDGWLAQLSRFVHR